MAYLTCCSVYIQFFLEFLLCNAYQACPSNAWVLNLNITLCIRLIWEPLYIFFLYLGWQFKWHHHSSINFLHISCIHKWWHAEKWPDLLTSKLHAVSILIWKRCWEKIMKIHFSIFLNVAYRRDTAQGVGSMEVSSKAWNSPSIYFCCAMSDISWIFFKIRQHFFKCCWQAWIQKIEKSTKDPRD